MRVDEPDTEVVQQAPDVPLLNLRQIVDTGTPRNIQMRCDGPTAHDSSIKAWSTVPLNLTNCFRGSSDWLVYELLRLDA